MTSLNFLLTLTFLAVTSCHALLKPISTDSRQFLSQLLSSRLLSRPHNSPSSYSLPSSSPVDDNDNNDDDDDINDNVGDINADQTDDGDDRPFSVSGFPSPYFQSTRGDGNVIRDSYSLERAFPASAGYPIQNGMSLRAMKRLQSGLWSLPPQDSGLIAGRGKRYIPGLNALMMARLLGNRNARLSDAGKWKRQPHLGFHGSRG